MSFLHFGEFVAPSRRRGNSEGAGRVGRSDIDFSWSCTVLKASRRSLQRLEIINVSYRQIMEMLPSKSPRHRPHNEVGGIIEESAA